MLDIATVWDTCANFFLIDLASKGISADQLCSELRSKNVFIRNCDSMGQCFANQFVRIAVKDRDTNERLTSHLFRALAAN